MQNRSRRQFIENASILGLGMGLFGKLPTSAFASQSPTLIIYGGPILTIDGSNSVAEAIAISGNTILRVGSRADIMRMKSSTTRVIDLDGRTLMPGIIDGHSHFPYAGIMDITKVYLASPPIGPIKKLDDAMSKLRERASTLKKDEWLLGSDLFPAFLAEKREPTLAELDAVAGDHPLCIWHGTGHIVYANSVAMKLAGITKDTPNPAGGVFVKDPATGELNGKLEGNAQFVLTGKIPAPDRKTLLRGCERCSEIYLSRGVTWAQSMTYDLADFPLLPLLQEAFDNDLIKNRVSFFPRFTADNYREQLKTYAGTRTGAVLHPSGNLVMGAFKGFQDGSPGGMTAYYSKPYQAIPKGKPADYRGFPVYEKKEFLKIVKEIHEQGWQLAIHCNGDQAIEDVIDAYEHANKDKQRDARHIAIHAQFTRQDQLVRMRDLGIIPSFYPDCTYYIGDINNKQVGSERTAFMNPVGPAMKLGIPCTLHSDTPISPIVPFTSIAAAVNRKTMFGTKIGDDATCATTAEALRAVTINGAHEYFMEKHLGSLESGKLADMVVVDKNPLTTEPHDLMNIKVHKTFVGGQEVFSI